jgi:DNA-3-methyladenine glycosylase I
MHENINKTLTRCAWAPKDNEMYIQYHDKEWGRPVHDDKIHFEFIVLESAQAGLSWLTVLKKRENYKKLFASFNAEEVAKFNQKDIERLMQDAGIIRNRMKIEAAINNAKVFLEIQKEFGSFDKYIWNYVNNKPIINNFKSLAEVPARTELSDKISKDLKNRGFRFFGTTICYAHMQATGIVNDHTIDCFCKNI